MSMNSPEWIIILIGCIICAMNGATQTVLTILAAEIVSVSDLSVRIWHDIGFHHVGIQLLCKLEKQ